MNRYSDQYDSKNAETLFLTLQIEIFNNENLVRFKVLIKLVDWAVLYAIIRPLNKWPKCGSS